MTAIMRRELRLVMGEEIPRLFLMMELLSADASIRAWTI